jgi:mono/diheme cytochrome c family protein
VGRLVLPWLHKTALNIRLYADVFDAAHVSPQKTGTIMPRQTSGGSGKLAAFRGAVPLMTGLALWPALLPARADDFAFGRRLFLDKAQCLYCHGWAGDGAGEPQSNGAAANLRVTTLGRDQLIEVVKCGVPGKAMPHFDEDAYTDKRCYGVTEAELGRDTPALPPASTLNKREIEAVVDYLLAKVVGRGPVVTREECEEAYGDGARQCAKYAAKP